MKINNTIKQWILQRPKSYIPKNTKQSIIQLHLGECLLGPKIPKSIGTIDPTFLRKYPNQMSELKEKLAKIHNVPVNMVALSNGSDALISVIPQIFLNKKDIVLVVIPTFFRFADASQKAGAKVVFVKTKKENSFRITEEIAEDILKITKEKKIKLIWLCSPNNPTGLPIETRLIEKIAKNTNALIVLDQIYSEFQETQDIIPKKFIEKFPHVIILKSFSKVFGLAGIRVGFAIANKKTIRLLEMCELPFPISSLSLIIATQVLEKIPNFSNAIKLSLQKERIFLMKHLNRIPHLEIIPSQTNLFLIRHTLKDLFTQLLKRNILVANMNNTPGLENTGFVRISIGKRKENIQLIQALEDISSLDSERIIPSENLYEERR